ncbi:nuclear transport factor 2 family protein [uncultured Streptomyces sp.]|uniref:nuclear transport factor 2 family protein n=1 Tax=uncultured Streptomyces sp. TaxID=174707 RepID=UPI00262B2A48|nr:nuclear transport factor 2 family protein [uncultured Streptomyces sp.]
MTSQTEQFDIGTLVSRFFRALDERDFRGDWALGYVTDDVRIVTPLGTAEGIGAMDAAQESVERYARTQHIASDVIVDVAASSETAQASWNALMTHVHHDETLQQFGKDASPLFTVGGRYEAELQRRPEGWRISHMTVRAIWTTGHPPVLA